MTIWSKVLRVIERGLLALGLLLLVTFTIAHIHRSVMFRGDMTTFEATQRESAKEGSGAEAEDRVGTAYRATNIGHSLRSAQRIGFYQTNPGKSGEALAVLKIPRLRLEVPLLEGTDAFTLNRGVGRIAGTSLPGQAGNIGIAGHRDGFFRPLKDIRAGDSIELVTTSGTDVYAVDRIGVTNPADVSVLQPRAKPSLTLVTCYPFYFIGPAPKRYVVEAYLRQ